MLIYTTPNEELAACLINIFFEVIAISCVLRLVNNDKENAVCFLVSTQYMQWKRIGDYWENGSRS